VTSAGYKFGSYFKVQKDEKENLGNPPSTSMVKVFHG